MVSLVFGVGVNEGKYLTRVDGKHTKEYALWKETLRRCYCPKSQELFPTYRGCSVSENFRDFSLFHDWCLNQIGFGQKGYQLDKDLILKGNKLYSEETCLFLPSQLNALLISCQATRGFLPVGVSAHGRWFKAQCRTGKLSKHIGYFDTPELAFQAYKQAKEAFIKRQAEKWKNFIDPRAYEALMRYEILITD